MLIRENFKQIIADGSLANLTMAKQSLFIGAQRFARICK